MNPRALRIGLVAAVATVFTGLALSTVTPTRAGFTCCVPFPATWGNDGGMSTARILSTTYSRSFLDLCTFPQFTDGGPDFAYGEAEIQFYPAVQADGVTPDESQRVPVPSGFVEVPDPSMVTLRGSPLQPACQMLLHLQGAATANFGCACAQRGQVCTLTYIDGGSGPAPLDTTFLASKVSGAGCLPKPCVELSGISSMPAACQ